MSGQPPLFFIAMKGGKGMSLIGKTNEEKIWNYMKSKGLNDYAISGIMGNMFAESGLSPTNMQDSFEKKLGYNDATYTAAVDNGTYKNFIKDGCGFGITQTTFWSRKENLYNLAKSRGVSIGNLEMQLDFFWQELTEDFKTVYQLLQSVKSVKEASDLILTKFEMPGDMSDSVKNLRAYYSKKYYDNYANKGSGKMSISSTIVQNVINDAVNFAVSIANDNIHGYSQAVRSLYNTISPSSFDCSSLVCTSYYYAFIKNGLVTQANYLKSNCSYTGNMGKMINCGFEVVATNQTAHSQMKKGDIELNINYHTAMAIDSDNIVHARSSEGTNNTTDDSGNEIRIQSWYLYSKGWDQRLRFTGKGIASTSSSNFASTSTSTSSSSTGTNTASSTTNNNFTSSSNIISNLNKTTKFTGITIDELNVRTWAGKNYKTVSFSPLKKGTVINICDTVKDVNGNDWYYISYNGKTGFVISDYVSNQNTINTSYSKTKFIKDIQTSLNIVVDGIAGQQTLNAVPLLSKTINNNHIIVKYLQKYLNNIGYNVGDVDQIFGNKTESQIKLLQIKYKIESDGIVGPQTWRVILC